MICCLCYEKMFEVERLKMMCFGVKKKFLFCIGFVKFNNEIYCICGLYYKVIVFVNLILLNKDGDY